MIRDKLQKDSFEALKARDNRLVDVLRFLKSLIDKKEMQLPPGSLTEIEETKILNKVVDFDEYFYGFRSYEE